MKLVQGIMAAISAGMLIYAACCELLAADFILERRTEEKLNRHPGTCLV